MNATIILEVQRQIDLSELNHCRFVRADGIVTGRRRPGTSTGVVFLTLEDETGNVNVFVRVGVATRC